MSTTGGDAALWSALERVLEHAPPRAGSLVVTLFGDCISQHGGSVWLGGLVSLMSEFGLNARQTRTAIFRLARDGWFESEQRGRRSYYRFSEFGQRQYARAAARIYAAQPPAWDGCWTLLLDQSSPGSVRDELRKRLGWLGFGQLGNGLLAHPRADLDVLQDVIDELEVSDSTVTWRARPVSGEGLASLVRGAWQVDELAAALSTFDLHFKPFLSLTPADGLEDGRSAFVLRCLLIHAFRRVLLRTTELPPELLPDDWPGPRVQQLVQTLYQRTHLAACRYASEVLENEHGPLPSATAAFYRRFGGLAREGAQQSAA